MSAWGWWAGGPGQGTLTLGSSRRAVRGRGRVWCGGGAEAAPGFFPRLPSAPGSIILVGPAASGWRLTALDSALSFKAVQGSRFSPSGTFWNRPSEPFPLKGLSADLRPQFKSPELSPPKFSRKKVAR